ncbi:MAG: response regulator [Hyphomicrobiales bacterium]
MGKSVLVVDDEDIITLGLSNLLGRQGYSVSSASSGGEALAIIEAMRPDVVVLDVLMPGRDGYDICEAIKRNPDWRGSRVVLMGTTSRPSEIEKALALGAVSFITKPFSANELIAVVEEAFAESGRAA